MKLFNYLRENRKLALLLIAFISLFVFSIGGFITAPNNDKYGVHNLLIIGVAFIAVIVQKEVAASQK